MKNRAEIFALTKSGLNMLHVAAQGDSANALHIFKELGLDINAGDQRKSTPLHWACFRSQEIALSYLLAYKPEIDRPDQDGNTALHLACKYVDDAETIRLVRFLMLKGASTTIRNKKQELPINIAEKIEDPKMRAEVLKILGPPGTFDFLMLSTPTRKMPRRPVLLTIFFALFATIQACEIVNIYPHLRYWQIACNAAICLLCVSFALMAVCSDPGNLAKSPISFTELIEVFDATHLCPDCETVRTSRSRHCNVC
jgi:palmitoyltransferase